MQLAGTILDIYDDHSGRVLKSAIGNAELPETMKTASLQPELVGRLPNRMFALVATDGDETIRKYAMHDEPHLVTSLVYFMKCGHLLPEEAQKVAAHNLVNACGWYDIDPPEPLVKKAVLGKALLTAGTGMTAKEGLSKHKKDMKEFSEAQQSKTADLNGTEVMPYGAPKDSKVRPNSASKRNLKSKTAAEYLADKLDKEWIGPVDVTGLRAPSQVKKAEARHYCLPDEKAYPIDSYEHITKAASYFAEWCGEMDLDTRRTFANNLYKRASEVGIDLPPKVKWYAGDDYGTKLAGELNSRINNFEEDSDNRLIYEVLQEKVGSISPDTMVDMLKEADEETGISNAWNREFNGFLDPYRAVFEKSADNTNPEEQEVVGSKQWSWQSGGDYVNDTMLRDLATNRIGTVNTLFDDGFAKEFKKDPIGFFNSLPDPQKHVLARLASDNSGGSYRKT